MPEHILLYVVFLSQVILISFYLPRKMLSRMRYVVETYPPSKYPKLYPVSIDTVETGMRTFRIMNFIILLVGFVLVFFGVYSPSEEMLSWRGQSVVTIYFVLQFTPLVLAELSVFKYFELMRKANSRTTRIAELHPRRLFNFISPAFIGIAIFTYIAFICRTSAIMGHIWEVEIRPYTESDDAVAADLWRPCSDVTVMRETS